MFGARGCGLARIKSFNRFVQRWATAGGILHRLAPVQDDVFLRMVYLLDVVLDVVLVARRVEFTLLEFRRGGLVFPSSASMIFATTQAAEVNHNRHNQNHQINTRYGLSCIHHPGICQGCQGQEQKPEQRQ